MVEFYLFCSREKALLKISPFIIHSCRKKGTSLLPLSLLERRVSFSLFESLSSSSSLAFVDDDEFHPGLVASSRSAMMLFRPKKTTRFWNAGDDVKRNDFGCALVDQSSSSSSSRFFDRNSLFCSPPIVRHPIDAMMMSFFYALDASRRRSRRRDARKNTPPCPPMI